MKFISKDEIDYVQNLKKCIGQSVKVRNHSYHEKYQELTKHLTNKQKYRMRNMEMQILVLMGLENKKNDRIYLTHIKQRIWGNGPNKIAFHIFMSLDKINRNMAYLVNNIVTREKDPINPTYNLTTTNMQQLEMIL